jgi:hypothetical protein
VRAGSVRQRCWGTAGAAARCGRRPLAR